MCACVGIVVNSFFLLLSWPKGRVVVLAFPLLPEHRTLLHGLEAPVQFGYLVLQIRYHLGQLFRHFFGTYRLLGRIHHDCVCFEANGSELLCSVFAVEFLQQGAVLGRVVGDLWGGDSAPAERAMSPLQYRVESDKFLQVVFEPVRNFPRSRDGRAILGCDAEVPTARDGGPVSGKL